MRLQQWKTLENITDNEFGSRMLSGAGGNILDYSREIFLFVDGNEFKTTGRVSTGRMVIINMSASKPSKDPMISSGLSTICHWIDSSNMTAISMNIYTFDVEFFGKINDLDSTVCTVVHGIGNSHINDFDSSHAYAMSSTIYDESLRGSDVINFINSEASQSSLPPPIYYTLDHMYSSENDFYNIYHVDERMTFSLRELYDEKSRIYVYDSSVYLTMVPQLYDQLKYVKMNPGTTKIDPTEISEDLLYTKLDSMIKGVCVIYDTQDGVNIINTPHTKVGMQDFRLRNHITNHLEYMKDQVQSIASNIEKVHGSLRINFMPFYHADKIKMYFKDYTKDNQPIGESNEVGSVFNRGGLIDIKTVLGNDLSDFLQQISCNENYV